MHIEMHMHAFPNMYNILIFKYDKYTVNNKTNTFMAFFEAKFKNNL